MSRQRERGHRRTDRSTAAETASSPVWATLETDARSHIQAFVQRLLEEEVAALLGRPKSERRAPDAPPGYRNGHGRPRRLALTHGTITVRRPRVRALDARFESRLLPLFTRRTHEVGALLPELYLHGLATGDFELALRGLLGDGAPLSASSIQRLKAGWQHDYDAWRRRDLSDLALVYTRVRVDRRHLREGSGACCSSPSSTSAS